MVVAKLYNGIYRVLANDPTILGYLGIGVGANALTKAEHIQKRAKPQDLDTHIPLFTFYTPPGQVETTNNLVYVTPVIFDVYTNDNVELAQNTTTRIYDLLSDQISTFMGVESFESRFITAHESGVDRPNTYCFTLVLEMSISLDK